MDAQGDSPSTPIPPLREWDSLEPTEVVEEMNARTEFALGRDPKSPEVRAAEGLVIAIGNYECTSGRRDRGVLDAAAARLKELEDGERSKYW
jgi:hypothetical protein